MAAQPTSNLLEGCILQTPTQWPGRVQLVEAATEEQFQLLYEMPGVYHYSGNARKQQPAGWYLPQSIVDMGRLPGLLLEYSDDQSALAPSLVRSLREHQRRAVDFLRRITPQREGALLCADAGVGKCCIALQALYLDDFLERPGVVVGPLSAAAAWCGPTSDATMHYDMDIKRLEGKKQPDTTKLQGSAHFYVNYDILPAWTTWLCSVLNPAWVIFDECHWLIHAKAQRSEAAYKFSHWHTIERRIGLTGTPIPNYRMDLWNQLRCVQPRQWDENKHRFGVRFCGGKREIAASDEGTDEREYWTYDGETNDIELRARLAGTMLRYTRYEVQGALPELTRTPVRLAPIDDALAEYRSAERNIVQYLRSKGELQTGVRTLQWGEEQIRLKASEAKPSGIRLRAVSTLIGLLSDLKARATADEVCAALAQHDHIVVFTWRRTAASLIVKALSRRAAQGPIAGKVPVVFGPIDGALKQKIRQEKAQDFAAMKCGVYVATLGAAGIAINELSVASCAIFSDLHWIPAVLTQAESRIQRDGSPHEKVESRFLVVPNTIDELLLHHLTMKADAAAAVASNDLIGRNLVADLSTENFATPEQSVDRLCELLSFMEDTDDGIS